MFFSLFFLTENKKYKFLIKSHPSISSCLIYKRKKLIDNVCLGYLSLNIKYQFLVITYLNLLCSDIESNPGPIYVIFNYPKTTKNLRQIKTYIHVFHIQILVALTTNTKKFEIFLQQRNTQTFFIVTET